MVYEDNRKGRDGVKKDLAEVLFFFFFPYRESTYPIYKYHLIGISFSIRYS